MLGCSDGHGIQSHSVLYIFHCISGYSYFILSFCEWSGGTAATSSILLDCGWWHDQIVAVPSMRHVSDLKAYRPYWQELPLKLIYTINYEHNPSHHILCYSCSPPHSWAGPLPATLSIQTTSHSAFCSYQHSHTTLSSGP